MDPGDRPVPPGYEFIRVIGAGGYGEVVLARHVRLHRLVAIKSLHALALNDKASIERFRREARALALTECSAVVRVYDLCHFRDHTQLVMEYVPGQPLSALLEAGPLPASQGLLVLQDVAEALSAAASRGVIHRDVKPANVFILPDGRAKLGDFGLARIVVDASVFRTTGGPALGTPAYFPPEVSQGLAEPDERSDAYSFAVMAYVTLTGRLPFEGSDLVSLLTAHWRSEPPDPRTFVPGFPAAAATWLLRGMAKDPSRRPLAAELVRQLRTVPLDRWPTLPRSQSTLVTGSQADPTIRTPGGFPPSVPAINAVRAPRQRRRWMSAAAVAAVGAGCLLAGVVVVHFILPGDPDLVVEAVEVTADPASGRVSCRGGDVTVTAVFRTNGAPGELEYQWTRPDGVITESRVVDLASGQREAEAHLVFTVTGQRRLSGEAIVHVLAPGTASAGHMITYACGPR